MIIRKVFRTTVGVDSGTEAREMSISISGSFLAWNDLLQIPSSGPHVASTLGYKSHLYQVSYKTKQSGYNSSKPLISMTKISSHHIGRVSLGGLA